MKLSQKEYEEKVADWGTIIIFGSAIIALLIVTFG